MQLLTAKPIVYLCNVTQEDYLRRKNKFLLKIKTWIDAREKDSPSPAPIIPVCVDMEMKVRSVSVVAT